MITTKPLTLYCPNCGSESKVIGFIAPARNATAVYIKICPNCDRSHPPRQS